jgi:hypothetical protein
MDLIDFLCVSLDSSTFQLHGRLDNRRAFACLEAGFSSQHGDSAWGYTTEEQRSLGRVLWAKRLTAKDIHKEMFPLDGGKCLSRKAIHNWAEKFSQGCSRVADDARPGAEVPETTVKRLLCCGFRRTGKRQNKCINAGGGYVEKQMFFPCQNITCWTFYIHLWPVYWLSPILTSSQQSGKQRNRPVEFS